MQDEVPQMYARISRFGMSADPGAARPAAEDVLPALRAMDGFRGVISLVDQAGGEGVTITLWESDDAMRASEAKADEMRQEMAAAAGDDIRSVERFEVEAIHLEP